MPATFLAPPINFVGRDELISRFKARLEHYNFFLYEGISGIGKTSLVRRLAKETRTAGVKNSLYLHLVAGEGIASILARVEARTRGKSAAGPERQGDPFARLVELLINHRLVLVLDELHNFRREEFPALVRALRGARGPFRVLGTIRGDPELSAMDIMLLHLERLGPLTADEVRKYLQVYKLSPDKLDLLVADAARGGCVGQPLTLKVLLALCAQALPPKELLDTHSARSVNAFKAMMTYAEPFLADNEREAVLGLCAIGQPVDRATAVASFGSVITKLLGKGLLDETDGDVCVHQLVAQYYTQVPQPSVKVAVAVAAHLKNRAIDRSEPLSLIRAGKLLGQAGRLEQAVATLADGWDAVRDLGFLEAYLKILASIPSDGILGPRVALLSARARMRQGNPGQVREEMERLAGERDSWTRIRALASLVYIYNQQGEHERVFDTFESLRKLTQAPELTLEAGSLAAAALLRIGKITEAEKLARSMLSKIRGKTEAERQGELHRLLSQVYAQMGMVARAIEEAQAAATFFTLSGDLYHAATAYGFIGDMCREGGDFEGAQTAFRKFHELAQKWGDRNLIQIADLTEAWVSLDLGDMTSAQKRITAVEKELTSSASRRLRRYLAAARALLEAGRGHHEAAAELLPRVVEAWDASGQRAIASTLRAQLVRSMLACGRVDEASKIVDEALAKVDPKTQAPRAAVFLRESALIRLRRKDSRRAMGELAQACKLFAQGGNRREEAHTLYRIAHAALDEGDVALAASRAAEALALARKIKHPRVEALARELQGRIATFEDRPKEAVAAAREALNAIKRLGDEIGTLHVTESLLFAQIVAGDLAAAIRLGPKLSDQAEALQVRELRIRAIALTGVALVRRGRLDAAARCFRELPDQAVSAWTSALMWRLGEALAQAAGDKATAQSRREHWVSSVCRIAEGRQAIALHGLEQLALPPRERYQLRTSAGTTLVTSEQIGWLDRSLPALFVDVVQGRVVAGGEPVALTPEILRLLSELAVAAPEKLSNEDLCLAIFGAEASNKAEQKLRPLVKELAKALKGCKGFAVDIKAGAVKLTLPRDYGFVVPMDNATAELSGEQRKIIKLVRKLGTAPLTTIESTLKFERPQARREVDGLVRGGLLRTVREGKSQAFRLA